MAKNKEFIIATHYYAKYKESVERSNTTYYPVKFSYYQKIKKDILAAVQAADYSKLKGILRADYIYSDKKNFYTKETYNSFPKNRFYETCIAGQYHHFENPDFGYGQCDTVDYEVYPVAPVLIELFSAHNEDYQEIVNQASEEAKTILLDFSEMDFDNCSLCNLDLTNANLTKANLKQVTGLTQENLERSLTYVDAILPKGFVPFWNDEKKNHVLAALAKLNNYGEKLKQSSDSAGRTRGQFAQSLAGELGI